jgi:glycosyltransferase involved in cell wall biosynthesis
MKKILLILENPPYFAGGIERHCYNIMDLYKNDPTVEIDCICKDTIKYKWNKLLSKIVFDYKSLVSAVEQSQCDVVHVHGFASIIASQGLKASLSLGKKTIYSPYYHPFKTLRRPLLGYMFFYFVIKPFLSRVDTIIALNNEEKIFFQQYNKNVINIPCWITEKKYYTIEKRKNNMLLFVARNRNNKGFEHLNNIPADKYEIHCVTNSSIGVANHIKIHLNISNKDLDDLYAQAAVVVVPSRYESFSIVALEALERGVPIVISNHVRIADYLTGIKGWRVFQYGNNADFLQKIEEVIEEHVEQDKIIQHFSKETIKQKFDNIYTS